jgi:hypothetical protein
MSTKWKSPVRCPDCHSTAVRRRELIYESGTSHYSGTSSSSGLSFGLTGKSRPRTWFGAGSHSGSRQSLRAQKAEPMPYWPSLLVPIYIFFFHNNNEALNSWIWLGLFFSALLFLAALSDGSRFKKEWWCSKCATSFIPETIELKPQMVKQSSTPPETENLTKHNPVSAPLGDGKACSICGKHHAYSEFSYGNRSNNSYCIKCNKGYGKAYAKGGSKEARKFREKFREAR